MRLTDTASGVEVAIATSYGNRAFEMKVHGDNVLYYPFEDASGMTTTRSLNGIPFLGPWANRVAGGGVLVNGKKWPLNQDSGTLRLDANGLAIHGMLWASTLWKVAGTGHDANSAHVTSRLEFWKHPELMTNWPFAHEYEMTHRLSNGVLEVSTAVMNISSARMPVAVGFHPYFNLPGVPRDESVARIPVRSHVETDTRLVATGELKPVDFPTQMSLKDHRFDDGFTDLKPGPDGRTVFSVEGGGKSIDVTYGPKYPVAVIFAPPGQNYICFEPMAAVTNGINLFAEGKYPPLQWIEPGETWHESFWVSTSGI
ncbi:MAG TPA: aldose 1-epimerase [Bryobacteraceae bacterium]|nr:aldose 1-epimerase [Bryobacteraceae bacterium]